MSNPTIEAIIQYKENCDYTSSSTTCNIPLTKQDALIRATVEPVDYNLRISNNTSINDYYYNDILRLTIHVQDNGSNVTNGAVSVYYSKINTDTPSTENLINKTPILIDDSGYAKILYKPHYDGYFIIKYHNSNTYNDMIVSQPVLLKKIPTILTFENPTPNFVHLEDAVPLTVSVQDIYGHPLNYGVVTFLSYQIADLDDDDTENILSGQEKVIGNPVMVQNGYATTTYSPIQLLEEDILPKGTEFIRAVFNYENNLYGSSYKYYASHSSWTNIPLLYPSHLTIDAVTLEDGHLEKITMSSDNMMSDGFIHIKSNQHLMLKFTLTNNNNQRIALDNDNLKVIFRVKGTEDKIIIDNPTASTETYVNEYHQYVDYDEEYEATYYTNKYGEDNIFISDIGNIPTGYYTIQAYIAEGGHTISKGQLKDKYGNTVDIEDMYYYEAAESDKLYLAVDFGQQDYTIDIDTPTISGIYGINVVAKDNNNPITATININEEYYYLFDNQKCIFYIPKINQEYQGIIRIQNNTLKAILQDTIIFTYADDYPIYVYIKGKTYTHNNKTIAFNDVYSNPMDGNNNLIQMSARFNLIPSINIQYNSQLYVGNVDIIINIDNIFDETVDMYMELLKNNNIIMSENFTLSPNRKSYMINVDNLSAGQYTVKTKIIGRNFVNQDFNISKDILTAYNDTINTIPTGDVQSIKIYLNSNNNTLQYINTNKLHVYLKYNNVDTIYNIDNEHALINNNIITLNVPLYHEGEYQIKVKYDGDNNFETLNPNEYPIRFNTTTVYGSLNINRTVFQETTNISNNDENESAGDNTTLANYIDLFINYNKTNNQYIIGEIQATNYNNNKIFIPFISDKEGHIHLSNPINSYEWQSYNNFIVNIDPKNTNLINALLNSDNPQEAIEHYYYNNNSRYKYQNIDIPMQFGAENNTAIYFNKIKAQLEASDNEALFATYKKQTLMEMQDES